MSSGISTFVMTELSDILEIILHYMDMELDDNSNADTVEPPSNWPSSGKIEIRNFNMKYYEDLEYVLKDISLTINSGERIGIVGHRINKKATYGLDRSIGDYDRFSNGQKQLFSLCRLLMRKRKIIVLDEATADVDLETDKEMQKLFCSEFKDSTVLTIAHRLETIMNSDRIIVMDKGRVVEFGPPKELIDQGGYFSELVKAN
ncbi:Multidrug resistance-associated protein 1, partial [Coemansia sp. RSA 1939]